jgi:hypothetical protein
MNSRFSFDHFVGGHLQGQRLGRLHDREIGRLGALKNLAT